VSERDSAISVTELMASASKVLEESGYRRAEPRFTSNWQAANARLFEDNYSIVALVVYDTWENLSSRWVDAQSSLVSLISDYIAGADAKAWEGYLVLLTPNPIPKDKNSEMINLRYDTTRVRKLIGTGEDIKTSADVRNILLPLLPLNCESADQSRESILELLPDLLSSRGIPKDAVQIVINAFLEQTPIMDGLHHHRSKDESN